jgi:hypothetical protein
MPKLIQALAGLACAFTVCPWATSPAAQGVTAKRDPRDYMVLGCVSAEASRAGTETRGQSSAQRRFLVTDSRSKSDMYRLEGDADQLAFHVGHTVELTGTLSMPPTSPGVNGEPAALPTLKVKSLIYIASSCPK